MTDKIKIGKTEYQVVTDMTQKARFTSILTIVGEGEIAKMTSRNPETALKKHQYLLEHAAEIKN